MNLSNILQQSYGKLHILFMIWCQDKLPQPIKTITALNAHLRKWQFVKMTERFQLLSHWQQYWHTSLIVNNSLLTFIFQINCTYQNRNKIITESWFCTLFQQFPLCSGIPNSTDSTVLCSLLNTWEIILLFEKQRLISHTEENET